MAMSDETKYPPELTEAQYEHLVFEIQNVALLNGLAVKPPVQFMPTDNERADVITTAPVTFFPSLFPRDCFNEAREIQCAYNELYALISQDEDWVVAIVAELARYDNFISELWDVHLTCEREGFAQDVSLGIFRSDYMIDDGPRIGNFAPQLKQVEFNTVASSFAGLSEKVSSLHRSLHNSYSYPGFPSSPLSAGSLPTNESIKAVAEGLQAAHVTYGPSKSLSTLPLCIIFIVQEPESNIFDQYALSYELQQRHSIPVFRVPFDRILDQTNMDTTNPSRLLTYTLPHSPSSVFEVTTVYWRAGYSPSEYASKRAWKARMHIERSGAIKCPSVLAQLAGSKKAQQILATPGSRHLEDFLANTPYAGYIDRLRATFTTMYPLDDSAAGQEAIRIAKNSKEAKNFVLKPQREGGGNNIYSTKIPGYLATLGSDVKQYRAYILMEMIHPPIQRNTIIRRGQVREGDVISELGIYGVCMWRKGRHRGEGKTLLNKEAGFLLRTKGADSEEGGVAAGFGAIDSPCLV